MADKMTMFRYLRNHVSFNEQKVFEKGYKCQKFICNEEDQSFISAIELSQIMAEVAQCPSCPITKKHDINKQDIMGFWEKSRKSSQTEGQTYPFAKEGGPVDVLTSDIKAEVSKSVGLLYIDGQPEGTGFRVGDKYIMTCQHVIKDIIKQDGSVDDTRIRIEFERKMECQAFDPEKMLYFTSTLHYTHDRYDVAILELKERIDDIEYPPPLTSFSKLQSQSKVHLIGHPGGRQMKEDSEVWASFIYPNNACDNRIEDLKQWSLKNLRDTKNPHQYKDYYSVLRHPPRKILFDTTFVPGASGSPGIMEKNGKPSVVLIVRGGVPTCYYDHGVPVEAEKRVDYGYAMEDICKEMKKSPHGNIKSLAKHIFG